MRAARHRRRLRSGPWAVDVAARIPRSLPETGLGRGWEPAAIVFITVSLLVFGLITLHSASSVMAQQGDLPHYHYVARQGIGVMIGLAIMVVCACVPTEWWRQMAHHILLASILLLIIVVLPFTEAIAPSINGARRWLRLGITVQPSDLAKLAVLIWTAALAVRKREYFHSLGRGLAPFLVAWSVVLVLVLLEPDLSTAVLIAAMGATIVVVAGARPAHFVFLGLLAAPFIAPAVTSGYRRSRWESILLEPGTVPDGATYQSYQSLVAIGSGGVTGVGFGEGRQKFGFLPEAHNDFIFAMIGEEWGLVGALAVILCYVALIAMAFRVARRARNLFSELLAIGVGTLIGLQAFLHIGVGLGVFPTTGLSLPFISFGRTNLVAMLAAVGILLAVAREMPEGRTGRAATVGG
ncbi:MAG: putative peptidoglycan glycosyltransferase FtsW [Gemmatimonadota bacterium]|nr:putative peptidoglycan glycosyltransferase FtsW [Gemmatimonadota bacterium]MDE2865250.1 putative peptidoglycan glycosyltransferase FtsW [Gemmatimonadota bacterium]